MQFHTKKVVKSAEFYCLDKIASTVFFSYFYSQCRQRIFLNLPHILSHSKSLQQANSESREYLFKNFKVTKFQTHYIKSDLIMRSFGVDDRHGTSSSQITMIQFFRRHFDYGRHFSCKILKSTRSSSPKGASITVCSTEKRLGSLAYLPLSWFRYRRISSSSKLLANWLSRRTWIQTKLHSYRQRS